MQACRTTPAAGQGNPEREDNRHHQSPPRGLGHPWRPPDQRQMRTFPMRETPHNYSTCREPSTRRTCLAISLAGAAGSVCSDIC